ncbi:ATP-binding cassette domain-containing protein [Bordetella sp. BOR01]|uniref:branched-chain amino acid ABC transporter ATP-binding protein/permease n=1 Tax=Bordetella sp. BOR01 TaxID=2854779 RepID=UPI001C450167|nr:ATP-binding cassette domain-containing protein [Bordetella sp. BOR01]MBV7484771.1 ATP-binding cassette domain-containing protein [Bordetella sp. BOR01]
MKGHASNPVLVIAAFLLLLTAGAFAMGMPVSRITQVAIYALYGIGVNFLIGYLGLVPFGASFFFGVASYGVAIFSKAVVSNEIVALAFSAAFSLVLAVALGAVILRRRGLYFSLLTLACSQIAFEIAYSWTSVTGGENGIQDVPRPLFGSTLAFHFFTLAVVLIAVYALWRLVHAPFGRVLQAIRDNEQRVSSLGFNALAIKLAAFCISGMLVGVGGGLMALLLRGAYANNLSWQHAGDPVLMAVLGGVHHFLGPLWGATTFIILEDRLSAITENWWLMFAPIIILFAILSPEGMHGILRRWIRRDERWTLVRHGIPPRPASIAPYAPAAARTVQGSQPILSVRGLSKRFGSIVTSEDISLDVHDRRLHSLIGPNGAGKTTLFNILTGLMAPDAGTITLDGRDVTRLPAYRRARAGLSRSFQILSVFPNLTTFENVRVATQGAHRPWGGFWRDAYDNQPENARVWSLLDAVGLADRAADLCSELSHGEKRLLEIALSLAGSPRVLLLDEPLAGLGEADRQVVSALIVRLSQTHAVLLIEHDIDRVLALSDRITVLHQGRLIADGLPDQVSRHPDVISAYMGKPAEEAGAPRGAAPAVPVASASRTDAGHAMPLLELSGVKAGYAGGAVLDGLDLVVQPNEVVALLGRNGVGKTTTLRTIMGVVKVSQGNIRFDGQDITHARPDQINRQGIAVVPEGRRLFPNLTVHENLRIAARAGGASQEEIYSLFPKLRILAKSRAENLSGGERQMVAVARALMAPTRLILLDEPFEGLAPAVVKDIREAVQRISRQVSMIIVEHHAESALALAERAYVLVNGRVAYAGPAHALSIDVALQQRLLGVGQQEAA